MGYLYLTMATGQRIRNNWVIRLDIYPDGKVCVDFVHTKSVCFRNVVKVEILPE